MISHQLNDVASLYLIVWFELDVVWINKTENFPMLLMSSYLKDSIFPMELRHTQASEYAILTQGVILKQSSTRLGQIGVFEYDKKQGKLTTWILPENATISYLEWLIGDLGKIRGPSHVREAQKTASVIPLVSSPSDPAPTLAISSSVSVSSEKITSSFRGQIQGLKTALEDSVSTSVTNVVICSDFDGTATGIAGGELVHTERYRTLLTDPSERRRYNDPSNSIRSDVQRVLLERFGPYTEPFACYQRPDSDMLISKEAVAFYHVALASPNSDLIIVTKNRDDYVKALFEYHGFTPEEMGKLKIRSQHTSEKAGTLISATDGTDKKPIEVGPGTRVYVFDDNEHDYRSMLGAFQLTGATIQGHRAEPGTFEWAKYRDDLEGDLAAAAAFQLTHNSSAPHP